MKIHYIFLTLLCLIVFPAMGQTSPFKLLIMGDSLSAGYDLPPTESFDNQLDDALKNKGYQNLQVINFSRSGETATGGVAKLQSVLDKHPNAVLLELGINDALHNVPVADIQKNLEQIIQAFKQQNIPIMLIGMEAPLVRPAPYQQEFKKMYADLAKKYSLIFYPFFMDGVFHGKSLIAMQLPNENVLGDRIHPSAKGIAIMVKKIMPTVEKFLKQNNVRK